MSISRPAIYQTGNQDGSVTCTLCPHLCRIQEGQLGLCKTRHNHEGTLWINNYGKVVSYAIDPIEKKPLNHFFPGSTIFSIGTNGCNFKCQFCQNHELVNFQGTTQPISPESIINAAKESNSVGIAFTYNEPTIWYEYVMDVSRLARKHDLKTVWVTNGFINPEPFMEVRPFIDAMNIDLKSFSNDFYTNICSGTLSPVLNTIKLAHGHVHIELTTLLIDGLNTTPEDLHALCKWISDLDPDIPLHLNRYFPAYQMTIPKTRLETMRMARDIAKQYLTNVHVGNCFLD